MYNNSLKWAFNVHLSSDEVHAIATSLKRRARWTEYIAIIKMKWVNNIQF